MGVEQAKREHGGRDQGGVDGGRSQGAARSQMVLQRPARMEIHGGVDGGRSHGGEGADDTRGPTGGDCTDG